MNGPRIVLRGGRCELLFAEFIGFECFIMNFIEGRDAVIPFQQRGGVAD